VGAGYGDIGGKGGWKKGGEKKIGRVGTSAYGCSSLVLFIKGMKEHLPVA